MCGLFTLHIGFEGIALRPALGEGPRHTVEGIEQAAVTRDPSWCHHFFGQQRHRPGDLVRKLHGKDSINTLDCCGKGQFLGIRRPEQRMLSGVRDRYPTYSILDPLKVNNHASCRLLFCRNRRFFLHGRNSSRFRFGISRPLPGRFSEKQPQGLHQVVLLTGLFRSRLPGLWLRLGLFLRCRLWLGFWFRLWTQLANRVDRLVECPFPGQDLVIAFLQPDVIDVRLFIITPAGKGQQLPVGRPPHSPVRIRMA